MVKSWFNRILPSFARAHKKDDKKSPVPQGLWQSCPNCKEIIYGPDLESNLYVCMNCDHHIRIGARKRLEFFLDPTETIEISQDKTPKDWLKFKDTKTYKERIDSAEKVSNEKEALLAMKGYLKKMPIVASAFEFRYMGGSMGSVVGQKFVDTVDFALENKLPMVCFSTSGGARMQESLVSLFQMAKTSAAIDKMRQAKLPYISVMIDPIYGGVSASLAMLGDINIAEPRALVGFTGPRVIEQTLNVQLPEGFQRSEFLLEHGAIDMIVHRKDLKDTIHRLLSSLMSNK